MELMLRKWFIYQEKETFLPDSSRVLTTWVVGFQTLFILLDWYISVNLEDGILNATVDSYEIKTARLTYSVHHCLSVV